MKKHTNGKFNLDYLANEGQTLNLSKAFPDTARQWSFVDIVKYCLQPDEKDSADGSELERRRRNLSQALESLKLDSQYQLWYIHLCRLADEGEFEASDIKKYLHYGVLHASEKLYTTPLDNKTT